MEVIGMGSYSYILEIFSTQEKSRLLNNNNKGHLYSAFPMGLAQSALHYYYPSGPNCILERSQLPGKYTARLPVRRSNTIILTISFTVLYAGYPYEIPGWGQKNLSCRDQDSNPGLFAPESSVLTSTPQVLQLKTYSCERQLIISVQKAAAV